MNLDFSDEQKLVQKTARDFFEENAPLEVAREVGRGLAEAGWDRHSEASEQDALRRVRGSDATDTDVATG